MRRWLYRLYLRLATANIRLGQYLFALRLSRRKTELAGADLSYLVLSGTNLAGADLRETDFRRSDLSGVDLTGADLSGANLTGARVSEEQLATAGSLSGTILPDGTIHI
jgi:serine/threonine-protein kinase